jgi:tetratricopeptide (TPR) repeat protein
MSTAARIDELRKKFDENPRRYFAPLANEYRKAGDLAQAIALCRDFLPQQPGHMSGHIVFGQALYEAGELDESRRVFEQALALDPENLIALRHLGDIAKATGDPAQARRWYERVLEADPRNDDIALQLASLVPVRPVTPVPPPSAIAAAAAAPAAPPAHAPIDLDAFATPTAAATVGFAATPTGGPPVLPMVSQPVPTPDAALRAIDVDAVNADLARHRVVEEALDSFEAHDPATLLERDLDMADVPAALQPIETVAGTTAADAAGTPAGLPSATGDEASAFEEGILAPEWPEAVPVLERLAHPAEAPLLPPAPSRPELAAALGGATDHGEAPRAPAAGAVEVEAPVGAVEVEAPVGAVEVEAPVEAVEVESPVQAVAIDGPVEAELDRTDEIALPWVVAPQPMMDDASEASMIAEIADAFAGDAREAGEPDEVTIETHETVETHPAPTGTVAPAASAAFMTETMAELLVSQGFLPRAIEVYEELVQRHPYDPVFPARLAELRETLAAASPGTGAGGAGEAAGVAVEAEPLRVDDMPSPAPSAVVATPREGVAMRTPIVAPAAVPDEEEARPRRSARAWLSGLASRRVARRTPARASQVVAEAPDGLAALFGSAAAADADDLAARTLAEAFAIEPPVPAARSAPRGATPVAVTSVASVAVSASPTPSLQATPASSRVAALSFDRFFPDPAAAAGDRRTDAMGPGRGAAGTGSDAGAATGADAGAAPAIDDLAQFSAWLKGLDAG